MSNTTLTPSMQADVLMLEAAFSPVGPVFVYSGQGGFWWGMGRDLLTREPAARTAVDHLDALFRKLRWPEDRSTTLWDELTRDEADCQFHRTDIVQPCLFALQVALTEYWLALGVEPAAVVGHSLGELAAAWAAGMVSLEEATRLLVCRLRAQRRMNGQGGMMAVALEARTLETYDEMQRGLVIAAYNGPRSVTVAGPDALLQQLSDRLRKQRILARRLPIDGAYHSPTVDAMMADARAHVGSATMHRETRPYYSTLVGDRLRAAEMCPTYWCDNIREPVRFQAAIEALLRDGYDTFVQVGAQPIHAREVNDILELGGLAGTVLPSLKRGEADMARISESYRALRVPRPVRQAG